VWIIFYKNFVSLNVYSGLKFFTWLFLLILIFPNSRQIGSLGKPGRGKADDPLYSVWLQWNYWEYEETDDLSSVTKGCLLTSHFCFLSQCNMMIYYIPTIRRLDPVQSVHQMDQMEMKTTYRGLVVTFVMIAKTHSNF